MEEATFNIIYHFINTILNLYLVCFAWRFSKRIKRQLSDYLFYDYNLKLYQFIISLLVVTKFALYLITGGIITYEFSTIIAAFILEITEYSDLYTKSIIIPLLGLCIFKQLSICIEKFLSDMTCNIFSMIQHEF